MRSACKRESELAEGDSGLVFLESSDVAFCPFCGRRLRGEFGQISPGDKAKMGHAMAVNHLYILVGDLLSRMEWETENKKWVAEAKEKLQNLLLALPPIPSFEEIDELRGTDK